MTFTKTLRRSVVGGAIIALAGFGGSIALADHDDEGRTNLPSIEGLELVTHVKPPDGHPLEEVISGFEYRTKDTQALELDDFSNPGFLWVDTGVAAWSAVEGSVGKSCKSCHGDVTESMKGIRAKMPKWDAEKKQPVALEQIINQCLTKRMGAEKWKWESDKMLGTTALIGLQSRGMPVTVDLASGDMKKWWERGKELYYTRVGQLDMSCSNCHEDNYGKYIRADRLSQGQTNGFPTYRLKWQKVGSLHRRFSGCMKQVRAKPYKRGSDEFVALELYTAWRGSGLSVETPAVRQ